MHSDPRLDATAAGITAALLVWAVVVGPLLARRSHRDIEAKRARDPRYLHRWLWRTVANKSGWCALTAAAVVAAPGLTWNHIGVTWPHGPRADVAMAVTVLTLAVFVASFVVAYLRPDLRKQPPRYLAAMLPHTRRERRTADVAAVTAGIAEEVLFRGLCIAAGLWLGLPLWASAAAVLVLFVAAHTLTDRREVTTALPGTVVTIIYVTSGASLLLPVLLHAVGDVLAFRTPQPDQPADPQPAETAS